MKSRPLQFRLPIVAVVLTPFLLLPLAVAADPPLATLRIESLDAALADTETVANIFDAPVQGDQLLDMALRPYGISAGDWLDRTRPVAIALPVPGMMLGAKGLVAALPVKDSDAALAALAGIFGEHEELDGRHTFRREDGTALAVEAHDGYLLAGTNPAMLRGFDLEAALSGAELPPGNVALDLRLEPIAPLLQAGLEQGRGIVQQQMAARAGSGEGGDAAIDPESMNAMLDLYFDVLQDATRNVRRVQISVEVTPEHGIFHKRLVPIAGSTLAGFLDAQSGGIPEISRLIQTEGNIAGAVVNIQQTPESVAAIKSYFHTYTQTMGPMLDSLEEQPFSANLGSMMTMVEPVLDSWFECQRGDLAASFSFDPASGVRFTEVVGAANAEACTAALAQTAEIYAAFATDQASESWISMTPGALNHGGVEAYRYVVDFSAMPGGGEEDAEAMAALEKMMGGDAMETFAGTQRDLILIAGGSGAEERFKELADRAGKTKKWKKNQGALTEESFVPLPSGPGLFTYVDLGSLLANLATVMDEYREDFEVVGALPANQRRIVYGSRLADGYMTVEVALPFELIRALRIAAGQDEAEVHEHDGDVED